MSLNARFTHEVFHPLRRDACPGTLHRNHVPCDRLTRHHSAGSDKAATCEFTGYLLVGRIPNGSAPQQILQISLLLTKQSEVLWIHGVIMVIPRVRLIECKMLFNDSSTQHPCNA